MISAGSNNLQTRGAMAIVWNQDLSRYSSSQNLNLCVDACQCEPACSSIYSSYEHFLLGAVHTYMLLRNYIVHSIPASSVGRCLLPTQEKANHILLHESISLSPSLGNRS